MATTDSEVPVTVHIVEGEVLRAGDKVWIFNHLDTVKKIETRHGGKVITFERSEYHEEW